LSAAAAAGAAASPTQRLVRSLLDSHGLQPIQAGTRARILGATGAAKPLPFSLSDDPAFVERKKITLKKPLKMLS
jgi:hypothetical protein